MAGRTRLTIAGAGGAALLVAGPAFAAWAVNGTGSAAAKATSLPTGPTPTAPVTGTQTTSSITVSWSAAQYPGTSAAVPSYTVNRYKAASLDVVAGTCGGAQSSTSCTDTVTTAGTYSYTVTPTSGNWAGAEGAKSGTVTYTTPAGFTVTAPTTATAGTPISVTVQAKRSDGSPDTSYTGSKTLNITGPSSARAGTGTGSPTTTATVTFNATGSATVPVTLVRAETVQLTMTDSTVGAETGASGSSVAVAPATASNLAWTSVNPSAGTQSSPCAFTCTVTALGNAGTLTAKVSVTDAYGNTVSNLGTTRTVTVTTPGSGIGSGGAFTLPTAGTSVSLTIPASGPADSTGTFTFKAQNGSWTSDTLSTTITGTPSYASASASVTKQ